MNLQYQTLEESGLSPREWLKAEKARLDFLGLESGQNFRIIFHRDAKQDEVINLGRFERKIK